ncbi:Os06g0102600, partial [Oryza sativa Japonica Group]
AAYTLRIESNSKPTAGDGHRRPATPTSSVRRHVHSSFPFPFLTVEEAEAHPRPALLRGRSILRLRPPSPPPPSYGEQKNKSWNWCLRFFIWSWSSRSSGYWSGCSVSLWSQRTSRGSDDKPEAAPYTSEELMKVIEEQLAASAAAAWNTQEPPPSQQKGCDIFFVPVLQLEAAATSESNDGAISRGSDGAGAAMSEPNRNISEKTETER